MPAKQSAGIKLKNPATIEEHRKRLGVDPAHYAGVCEAQGWRIGRTVSASEFEAALKRYKTGATQGGWNGQRRN